MRRRKQKQLTVTPWAFAGAVLAATLVTILFDQLVMTPTEMNAIEQAADAEVRAAEAEFRAAQAEGKLAIPDDPKPNRKRKPDNGWHFDWDLLRRAFQ